MADSSSDPNPQDSTLGTPPPLLEPIDSEKTQPDSTKDSSPESDQIPEDLSDEDTLSSEETPEDEPTPSKPNLPEAKPPEPDISTTQQKSDEDLLFRKPATPKKKFRVRRYETISPSSSSGEESEEEIKSDEGSEGSNGDDNEAVGTSAEEKVETEAGPSRRKSEEMEVEEPVIRSSKRRSSIEKRRQEIHLDFEEVFGGPSCSKQQKFSDSDSDSDKKEIEEEGYNLFSKQKETPINYAKFPELLLSPKKCKTATVTSSLATEEKKEEKEDEEETVL